jgi:hypothetical protein
MSIPSGGQPGNAPSVTGMGPQGLYSTPSSANRKNAAEAQGLAARMARLLEEAPVDLARVGQEIRAEPGLEALVLRLTASLILSPEGSAGTLEEATVALGTDRLRVLIETWSLFRQLQDAENIVGSGTDGKRHLNLAAWTPAALYIASLLRRLGVNSPGTTATNDPLNHAEFEIGDPAALTETLVRDFICLMPMLDPKALTSAEKTALAGLSSASWNDSK